MTHATFLSLPGPAALIAASPALAQQAPDPDVAAKPVAELSVTATRTAQDAKRVGASVTVLNDAAIRASQATVVADLLATSPAVSFTRNGGPGTSTTVNIRGAEGQHTVVLIDGVKLNDPSSTQGGFNFGNLLVGDIERIEILRGAQSTLWGSQAIGGVVNIITAVPTKPLEASLDLEGGSRRTASVRAGVGGRSDQITWRLAGEQYTTDGFSAYRFGTEDDGYHNTGLSGRIRADLTDAVSVEARAVWSRGRTQIDGFNIDSLEYGRTEELVAYGGVNLALFDGRLKNRFGYAYTDTQRENMNPGRPAAPLTFDAQGENRRWEYQGAFALQLGWTATFGAETETAEMRTRSPSLTIPNPAYRRGKAGIDSLYGQLQAEVVPGLTLTAGLRHDEHDTYGGHTLGQAAAAWALNDGATVLRASFGQGFRAPGLYELYSEYGALGLNPEAFDSWDAGIEQHLLTEAVKLTATYFHRDADNEIRFNSCAAASTDPQCRPGGVPRSGYYRNILKTKAKGVELQGEARLGEALRLKANYTWTDAEVAAGANTGKKLTRRPEHMGNVSATWAWTDAISTTAAVRYVGDTFNNDVNTVVVKGYTLVDLRASWALNDTYEVYGRVENLFDEDYQTILNYGTAGRGGFVGVRARF